MRIVYIADDGKEFDNEYDCENYEFLQRNPCERVEIYGGRKRLGHPSDDTSYNLSTRVVIKDEKTYEEFHNIAREYGWCEWQDEIDSVGDWRRLDEKVTSKKHWYNVCGMEQKEIDKIRRMMR